MTDDTLTGEFQVDLPRDLLAAATRPPRRKGEEYRVETWRPSWLTRLSELLVGKD